MSAQPVSIRLENPKSHSQYNISEHGSSISPWLRGLLLGALAAGLILSIVTALWLTERKIGTSTTITTKTTTTTTTPTTTSTTSTTASTATTTVTYVPTGIYALTIPTCATWNSQGITVAGNQNGNLGSGLGALNAPVGIFVDNSDILVVADRDNHRVMKYYPNSNTGEIVAGDGSNGSSPYQLNEPKGVAIDQLGNLIVADSLNYRIQKFVNGSLLGVTLFSNNPSNLLGHIRSLYLDVNNNMYLTDSDYHQAIKYSPYLSLGTILAGGGPSGSANNQLFNPYGCFIDAYNTLYVADSGNNRVMKYVSGSTTGTIVAGSNIAGGSGLNELQNPTGVIVDNNGYIYVSDSGNDRIMKWTSNYSAGGACVVGCTGSPGTAANELFTPRDLKFDQHGNLYVSDQRNNRIQKFSIQYSFPCAG